jgi:hypothetical protein
MTLSKIKKIDLDALGRAMTMASRDPAVADQLQRMLAQPEPRSWEEVAQFAAYHCQIKNLQLKPWEDPPKYGELHEPDHASNILLRRLLRASLSRFEPDPMAALERLEAEGS